MGSANGIGTNAQFANLTGITTDAQGNVYVTDAGNFDIPKNYTRGNCEQHLPGGQEEGHNDGNGAVTNFLFLTE